MYLIIILPGLTRQENVGVLATGSAVKRFQVKAYMIKLYLSSSYWYNYLFMDLVTAHPNQNLLHFYYVFMLCFTMSIYCSKHVIIWSIITLIKCSLL